MNKKSDSPKQTGGELNSVQPIDVSHEPKAAICTAATKDPFVHLGDCVCEILTFCYSDAHRESLRRDACEMGGTLEQIIAAAIAQMISERFEVRYKTFSSSQND